METKDIIGFEDYTIDKSGNVFSKGSNIFLKHCLNDQDYLVVSLYKNGKRTTKRIHQLLGEHFLDNPNNYECIDHIDRDRTNNDLNNLRWVSHRQNGQNMINQSIHGHNIQKRKNGNFQVQIIKTGKTIFCKTFKTLNEAIENRDYVNNYIDVYEQILDYA